MPGIPESSNGSKGKRKLSPPQKAAAAVWPVGGASHTGLQINKISVFFTPSIFPPGILGFRRFRGNFFSSLHYRSSQKTIFLIVCTSKSRRLS